MSIRNPMRVAFWIAAMVEGLTSSAGAVPLQYKVVVAESEITANMNASAFVTVSPDPLNQFPQYGALTNSSTTQPTNIGSQAVADVGLPGNFNNGANGITISQLTWSTYPAIMNGFGVISIPLNLTGPYQLIGYTATVGSLSLTLDSPLTSSLTPLGSDQWAWAGLGNVTISGTIDPTVAIPTKPTITLGSFPFSENLTIPLAGTFSVAANHTDLTLGIPTSTLKNQSLGLPPINVSLDPTGTGLVTATFGLNGLVLADLSTAIVYRNWSINTAFIPEPQTALLLSIGLVGLAVRRRH